MKSKNSTAQIKCTKDSHIHFRQLQCIHITNLEFIGCGGNQVKQVEEFMVQDAKFKGQENSGTALEIIETTAQIVNNTFLSNRKGSYRQCVLLFEPGRCFNASIGGAIIATNSTIDISQSKFEDNGADYGGVIFADHSIISILSSGIAFINNIATIYGGILYSRSNFITIEGSEFHNNNATYRGGVMYSFNSTIKVMECKIYNSFTKGDSGVLHLEDSNITIVASGFYNNHATNGDGGVMSSLCSNNYHNYIYIEASEFCNNSGTFQAYGGGVIYSDGGIITVEASRFHHNAATKSGGVMYSGASNITISNSNFTENNSPVGAMIYATTYTIVLYCSDILIDNNLANNNSVIYLFDSEFKGCDSGNVTISNNLGSLTAFNSNISIKSGYTVFVNNQPSRTATGDFQEGGAITLYQSSIVFNGECKLEHNHAENGGAIHSTESVLYVNGNVTIAHNAATGNGGGVYLSTSKLNCQQKSIFVFFNNSALYKGGGLHAISSSIKAVSELKYIIDYHKNTIIDSQYIGTRVNFTRNVAKLGGGLSLEANAKFYILKYKMITFWDFNNTGIINTAIFTGNIADYGGAVFVNDDTNSGTCANDTKTECFFQVLAHYDNSYPSNIIYIQCMYFSQNYATVSGSSLYGGLLDRCAVSQLAELYLKYPGYKVKGKVNVIAYFKNISIITKNFSISSDPVQVCLCTNDIHDNCTHQAQHIKQPPIKKGEIFNVSLAAVDQTGRPVNAVIQTSLRFTESGLAEGQLARKIPARCTNLNFSVISPHDAETLALYASDGPCGNAKLSTATVEIHFCPCSCPIGLQVNSRMYRTNCTCECHHNISQYMKHCDSHTGLLV